MKKQKPTYSKPTLIIIMFFAIGLTLLVLGLENRTKLWYRLFWPGVQDIGLAFEFDSPDYGQFTLTNTSVETAHNMFVAIREDFSYAGEGHYFQNVHIGDLEPGEKHICSYRYWSPSKNYDIGRLDLWFRCDRGKAFESIRWSYAGW